ncbi:hypothetical protein E8E12_006040 [Didymella heteroderae]|uniref:Uncharacterized protein n=1 Tax=Didymella heteroderae TaxID=1769908 RepID=A0A9P5BYV3_9PLEO|nr:hypothetical protein E8E12_006040 [Didymella heteroderae]
MPSIPITRRYQTTDQTAPWEGIVFIYEVGTDELSEALRVSFSQYRTLRERKCAAVIAFFQQELNEMQFGNTSTTPAKSPPGQTCPHPEAEIDTQCGGRSRDHQLPPASPASSRNSSIHRDPDKHYSAVQTISPLSLPAGPTLATSNTAQSDIFQCTHMDSHPSSLSDATGPMESFQRGISIETDVNDAKPCKATRLEHSASLYRHDPDTFHQNTASSHYLSRRPSNASEQSFVVPNESQGPVEIGSQHDTSGVAVIGRTNAHVYNLTCIDVDYDDERMT